MGQPVRSVTDYVSALLQQQLDAWRDELVKSTSTQTKAHRDAEFSREAESNRKKNGSGVPQQSPKNRVSAEGPNLN